MMRVSGLFLVCLLPISAGAAEKSYSTPNHRAAVVVNSEQANHRICYYQDLAYSEGALLEVGGYLMRCENANQYETNGKLKWVTFAKSQQSNGKNQSSTK
ncbi:DUF1496 domain-containing protein [Vibrio ponticus]|uniref:DUF1496 domain-containing protein n=1 Tax=Vibrio ponticus TaxID=265668 RepID=A0A3N3DYD0_9VIBR|nr:DUF1496 domain-containing protein [Vibrio ponticus]ROV59168.1 DUF1496 domain-containing protein [Vibrio ponticus]